MTAYRDAYDRIHDKLVTPSDPFPCNNAFLYSAYALVAGLSIDIPRVQECFTRSQTKFGYNRHPDGKPIPASSHDELVGMMMMWPKGKCLQAYTQYQSQRFQICNLDGFVPIPWNKLNPLRVLINFWRLGQETNPRKATPNYPYIWPMVFKHSPQQVYFYRRCAGLEPGSYLSLRFLLASLFTIWRGSNSSVVMLGFKLWKLSEQMNGIEKMVRKIYDGHRDFESEVRRYFPPDHPIIKSLSGKPY